MLDINKKRNLLLIVLSVKIIMFIFFHTQFHKYHYSPYTRGLFVISKDTTGYYNPIESFVRGSGYNSSTRMPGLLPIYGPLLYLFKKSIALNLTIILQVLLDIVSNIFLGLLAYNIFQNNKLAVISTLLYSISSFTSIWNHWGMADSFHISFLIIGVYYYYKFFEKNHLKWLFISAIFMTWSYSFRMIAVIPYGFMGLSLLFIMWRKKLGFGHILKIGIVFSLPVLLFNSLWIYHNYKRESRFIPFRDMQKFDPSKNKKEALKKLIILWGGDVSWSIDIYWFIDPKMNNFPFPFSSRVFTSSYNLKDLKKLRDMYIYSLSPRISKTQQNNLAKEIIRICKKYTQEYKKEHPFDSYFFNKIILFVKFVFPQRLDNLPFPAYHQMSWYHIIIKIFYLGLLLLINILGMLSIIIFIIKLKNLHFIMIPLSILFFLIFLGFIEQRYYTPIYPFMVILCSYILTVIIEKTKLQNLIQIIKRK